MRTYNFSKQQDLVNLAVQEHANGSTTEEIAKKIGKSRITVFLYLKHAGISVKRGPKRSLSLQEDFFELINLHEKAYWLGFLLADGHIPKNAMVRIELQVSDKHHLETLLKDVGSNSTVKFSQNTSKGTIHESARITLCSSKMKSDLILSGWEEFKKQGDCRIVQSVPDQFKPSLMRGLFDGDGCFMDERATFVDAHLPVVFWFQEQLIHFTQIRRAPIEPNPRGTSYVVKWSGGERLCTIRNFLYSTPGPFLQRKKDMANQYHVKVPTLEKTAKQKLIFDDMKWCPKCDTRKSRESFSRSSRAPDKSYHVCKTCWYHARSS